MGPRRLRSRAQACLGGGPRSASGRKRRRSRPRGSGPPRWPTPEHFTSDEHTPYETAIGEEVEQVLKDSVCSRTINTSFVERQHATDRGRNARKSRRTYWFSKDWEVHESMTYFTMYRYNFCWPVRTPRERREAGRWQPRTPAMAAGLADHVWSLDEWLTFLAVQWN